ncbi:tautomerase family protein [Catenulispora rubra]|uniref:tautomerase family protein n=1 Tax=Catenulispora rubra TaxID=280293 RepID=UPI0018922500|nr:tautomerase family protein [Catenulispora rubra]
MPFVDISLVQGKSPEYRRAVSRAVYEALVAELAMKPDDDFPLVHELAPDAMVRFHATLVRLLGADPGISPADVFVMMTLTPPENFSFADGVIGTDVVAVGHFAPLEYPDEFAEAIIASLRV